MKRTKIVSGALFHNFDETPLFTGTYVGECFNNDNEMIGYYFADTEGEQVIIPNSFAIKKALESEIENMIVKDMPNLIEIEFKGKIIRKNGLPFNRYEISIIE